MTLGTLLLTQAWASAADVASEVRAHVAAGEFAPAVRLAETLDNAALRDRLLREIAAAQNAVGAGAAANQTIGRIADDRARAGAVGDILAQRIAPRDPVLAQGGLNAGGAGGGEGTTADFAPVIDLMKATIEPETWDDNGGTGAVKEFPGGVLVDSAGVLRRAVQNETTGQLASLRQSAAKVSGNSDLRKASPLRKVSLNRLEKAMQMLRASGRDPSEAMQVLAGLQRVQYVLVYPESGDLVLAGPAGDWHRVAEGRVVSVDNGRPVLQLDDLVVILRHTAGSGRARFGCSIDPLEENLARTQAFLNEAGKRPLPAGRNAREAREIREEYVEAIREKMGRQKIDVFGIDPRTRVGRVLVEADYRMKLVGLGIEKGAGDLKSYPDMLKAMGRKAPQSLDMVRWWFALNYDAIQATSDRTAFALRGQGVKLVSENEMLAEQGKRVQTGRSEELNRKFAESFTRNFPALAAKYSIYAELQNLFDLALVASLISSENLAGKVSWHMSGLCDPAQYQVAFGSAPKSVATVAAHRFLEDEGRMIIQVSGGVQVDTASFTASKRIDTAETGALKDNREQSRPAPTAADNWWWD